jgi:hypothetical protein
MYNHWSKRCINYLLEFLIKANVASLYEANPVLAKGGEPQWVWEV